MSSTATPMHVEKLMSLSRAEFENSLAALAGADVALVDGVARIDEAAGRIAITFHALPPKRFGGLLLLPQARVTLDVTGLDEAAAVAFLQRFDLAFQRGGG